MTKSSNSKGGKGRRQGRRSAEGAGRELEFRAEGQEYAQVTKMLGGGRCVCSCTDGLTRQGRICGRMNKRTWITVGDIVLVSLRDYEQAKADIIHKYTADEARTLKESGELLETTGINETAVDIAMAADFDTRVDFVNI